MVNTRHVCVKYQTATVYDQQENPDKKGELYILHHWMTQTGYCSTHRRRVPMVGISTSNGPTEQLAPPVTHSLEAPEYLSAGV